MSDAERTELEIHRHVFHDSPDFISFCRMDDTYVDVNPGFERFVGLPRDRIVGRTSLEIGLWPDAEQRDAFVAELRAKGELLGYHRRLRRFNGEVRDIEGWASIAEIDGEKVLVAIGRDVTQRMHDEAELRDYRDHLEQLVEQRTRELRDANHRLQVANNAKSTFLASMSHELRTPLNAILGYAQLLKMGQGLSSRQAAGLSTIEQSGRHLLALINDILDLARVEAGKLQLQPAPVDLPAFLAVVVDIVRVRAEEKSLLFRYEGANDLPRTVLVDEMRLRQILLNLLGNAVKFTDAGEVRLRAAVRPQGSRALMRFEVWDTGIGMSPEAMQRLFQPFEQVSDVRHRSGGAGLGLSISQALARLMGGEVQVQSMPGKGSCFTFELELAVLDVMAPAPEAPRAVTGYSGPRKRVLIVDDIAANRSMLADTLQMLGFDTAQAEDGKQALEQASALCPDLIVMDVVMPEMDGMEATRRLRATRESGDRLPIIAVSASSSQGQAQECLAAGADAYLAKPLALPQLLERIGALLQLDWTH